MMQIQNTISNVAYGKLPLYKSGDRYNQLTITGKSYTVNRFLYLEYICDCGNIGWSNFYIIRSSHTKSCGCLKIKLVNDRNRTHGLWRHPLYSVWQGMKRRCYNKNEKAYPQYGGRGVVVCAEWVDDFKAFYDWAILNGWKEGLELDKDKLSPYKRGIIYSPEFCCFLTSRENMKYRASSINLEYKGEVKSLIEWCEITGIKYDNMRWRLKKGWDIERAFNKQ